MQKANVCQAVCEVLLPPDIYSSKINAGSGERIVNIDHLSACFKEYLWVFAT